MKASTLTCSGVWAPTSVASVAAAEATPPRKIRRETSFDTRSPGVPTVSELAAHWGTSASSGRPGSDDSPVVSCALISPCPPRSSGARAHPDRSEAASPDQAYHHEAEEQEAHGRDDHR